MNKYQEALNKIVKSCCPNCNDENGCSSCDLEKICNCTAKSWVDTLQELVDRTTPKKPMKIKLEYMETYVCPNCRHTFEGSSYCRFCGQALEVKDE